MLEVRELLAAEKELPPTNVINLGLSGDTFGGCLILGRLRQAKRRNCRELTM